MHLPITAESAANGTYVHKPGEGPRALRHVAFRKTGYAKNAI
jgi:hypothetical protein